MFLDRERELQFLERRYGMGGPEFIVIYGRRRGERQLFYWNL
ncbi:hypothetical protein tca_00179 [Methanothermobacter sp. EMTCatA1]|jgi:AAA+ ATPase superfamily predicted ATPase|nr:hypothetical protein tca_00179 [Methanothermobacter sp. EMTCatA1]